jgi:hypothetical protein
MYGISHFQSTCKMECQIQWRRHLSREASRRSYQPRPQRPDTECESCGARIQVRRAGPLPRYCPECRVARDVTRSRGRTGVRHCHKCQAAISETVRKPGLAVCDGCRADPRERSRDVEERRRLRRYGLTQEEYDRLLASQGGRCAGCGTDQPGRKNWCIDHCHKSGQVRALLCYRCNLALGMVDENPATLRALADLAEQFQTAQSGIKI